MASMKLFRVVFLLLVLFACLPAYPQSVTNPLSGNIKAQDTGCLTVASCTWQKLPSGAGTTSITLSGTFSATLQFEISADNGTTWVAASTASSTSAGVTTFSVSGYTDVRVRCSTYSSGVIGAAIFSSTSSSGGSSGPVTLAGNGGVSNGQWVTTGDVLWAQYTTQGLGIITMNQSYRILQPNGTVTNGQWSVASCNLNTNGGFGTGIQVPVSGWLQALTTYSPTGGFPQGSMYVNLYLLNSMPAGGGTSGCVSTLVATNIGNLLASAPTGSSYPVSFFGTSSINVSPWAIPGFTSATAVTTPAAGADWVSGPFGGSSVTTGQRACIQGVFLKLVTSATVANRNVAIELNFGSGATQLVYMATIAQPASSTVFYSFAPGTTPQQQTLNGNVYQAVPFANGAPICFNANAPGTVASVTGNLQSGDQYSNISILTSIQMDND